MPSSQYGHDSGWDASAASGLLGLIILVAAAVTTIVIVMVKELFRIYMARAFQGTNAARLLWGGLAAFLLICLAAGVLLMLPSTRTIGLLLPGWGFFLLIAVAEACDAHERHAEHAQAPALDTAIEDVLVPWEFAAAPLGDGNGHYVETAGPGSQR